MARPDLQKQFEHLTESRGFTKSAGFRLREMREGFVALEMAPREDLLQFFGYVHAGVVTGLADHAAGAAYTSVLAEGKICLTIELKINFMKPAEGETIVAEASVLSGGGSIGVVQTNVFAERDGARALIATAIVTLKSVGAAALKS